MKPIELHHIAAREGRTAVGRYERMRPGLGAEFRTEFEEAFNRIQQNPQLYGAISGPMRICPLHRFPYSIVYEELADRIWVAAIAHNGRRPGYWKRRRPS